MRPCGLGTPGLLPLLLPSSVILGGSDSTSVCPPSKLGSVIESVDKLGQAGHWRAWHTEDAAHKGALVHQSTQGCISLPGEHRGAGSDCRPCRKSYQPQAVLPASPEAIQNTSQLPSHLLIPRPFPFPSSSVIHLLFPIFLLLPFPSFPPFLLGAEDQTRALLMLDKCSATTELHS